jgi:hypothetical protein
MQVYDLVRRGRANFVPLIWYIVNVFDNVWRASAHRRAKDSGCGHEEGQGGCTSDVSEHIEAVESILGWNGGRKAQQGAYTLFMCSLK